MPRFAMALALLLALPGAVMSQSEDARPRARDIGLTVGVFPTGAGGSAPARKQTRNRIRKAATPASR